MTMLTRWCGRTVSHSWPTVNLDAQASLKHRLAEWKALKPKYTTGVFAKYAALVHSASEGAITKPK